MQPPTIRSQTSKILVKMTPGTVFFYPTSRQKTSAMQLMSTERKGKEHNGHSVRNQGTTTGITGAPAMVTTLGRFA